MSVLYLVVGGILLWGGAELFVRCSAALALRMGLTPLAVGLTVVAFGTSTPELGVSLEATLAGLGEVATGNVVGSNIANVALILGLAALIRPFDVRGQLVRVDVPIVVGASVVVAFLFRDGTLGRAAGVLLLAALAGYVAWQLRKVRLVPEDAAPTHVGEKAATRPLPLVSFLALVGLGVLALGAHALVTGAAHLAAGLGVSPAVIGLTVVAVGTSLPELATSVVAASRGEGDIAVGNVVGSNTFNLLGILGVCAVARPVSRGDVGPADFGVMIALSLVMMLFMRTGCRLSRREGALLLAAYAGYLWWLVT
ncbi:MAG: calcium/sodium antiporter [Gemmatimonadota bacterium]|nr:calcium/sodium antiporter [Gemmatimonadota bacterium]